MAETINTGTAENDGKCPPPAAGGANPPDRDLAPNLKVCKPIESLQELYDTVRHPPKWTKRTIPLRGRCRFVIKNAEDDCHVKESEYVPKERIDRSNTPRTLICHDMLGGYLSDKYIGGINRGNGFTFHRWAQSDIFCYFSHHFVTVPTLSWINVAHSHGTAVIGTVITEHAKGKELCAEFLCDESAYKRFADALVEVCAIYKFEGWLVNIENDVEKAELLLHFVWYLTEQMHKRIPGSYVIWYDSVIYDGKLEWQDELNERNRCFFEACDGIYLNYGWKEKELKKTKQMAKDRIVDVYVGIDIWGRGSYGGGMFNAYKAAQVINKFEMSMAIFAHGWEHEANPKDPERDFLKRYYSRSSLLWKLFWPYLYTAPIQSCFSTFFKTGVTSERYDLESQDVQPSYFPAHEPTSETKDVDVQDGVCRCLQERLVLGNRLLLVRSDGVGGGDVVHRLFATQIRLTGRARVDVYTDVYEGREADYELIFLLANSTNEITKVVGTSSDYAIRTNDVERVEPAIVSRNKLPVSQQWDHRFYILDYLDYELLEIGIKLVGGNHLYLCGFSINMK